MIVFAVIYGASAFLAFVGNLFVLLVVILYRSFHNMRYFLLASLALSDFLMAVLIASNRAVAIALEEWIFGTTWCHYAACVVRMLHVSTVFHLCAVSYERYDAIVKKPLTYNGRITKKKAFLNIMILWIVPAVISLGPLIGWGDYVYNPDIFTCEQKWDGQRFFPFMIASFLVPLVMMFIVNYKVLKVVRRLQRSLEVITIKPYAEDKTPDCQKQQPCPREDQDKDRIQRHPKQQGEQGGTVNGEPENLPQTQNAILDSIPPSHSNEMKDGENAAYQADPDDIAEIIYEEKVDCAYSAQCQSCSVAYCHNKQSSFKTTEVDPSKISKKTVERCSKAMECLHQKEKPHTLPQVVEQGEQDTSAVTDIQVHITEDNQSLHPNQYRTLEDGNGLQEKRVCETQTQEGKSGVIRQPSPDKICTEDACGFKSESERSTRVEDLKRNPGGKAKVSPNLEIPINEQALPEGRAAWVKSDQETCRIKSVLQGTSQDDRRSSDKSEIIESLPQNDSLQPTENHTRKPGRPPGKTQMRLAKLLKEGKAASDVIIIIGAFVMCYLPTWIFAPYRSMGGNPHPEAIISIHFVYSLSMVCNPIIYSIRKKEFRKALRKLLKF